MRFVVYKNRELKYPLSLLLLSVLLILTTLRAQPEAFNHPELQWKTIETEHFLVHYHQGTVRTANLVAKIAEEVYPYVTGLYQYAPKEKTEFIIRDTDDYSNGGAYFYDNKVEIWATNMDYVLRGTHNWLRDVVTHEYTHIISLRKAAKFGTHVPAGWLQVFGYEEERRPDVVRGFPNVLVSYPISGLTIPVWFAEGVSQFQTNEKRYDYRDSHREMILRDRVVNDKLLDLKQMSVFGKNSIGNESAYNQGFAFVKFLADKFGEGVLRKMVEYASGPLTLDFNSSIQKATGVSADSLFRLWHNYLKETYDHRLQTIRAHLKIGEPVQEKGIGNLHPVYSPDGKKVAYLTSHSDYLSVNQLVIHDFKTGKTMAVAGPVTSSLSWSPDGRYLVYSRSNKLQPNGSAYNDLFIYDLKRYREFQLTKAMRASNPDWSHDGKRIAFVVQSDGVTNIYVLELDDLARIKDKKRWKTRYYDLEGYRLVRKIPPEVRKNWREYYREVKFWGRGIRQLTHYTDGRQFYHPRWAPDDSYLVFDTSIKFARDIARVSAQGGEIEFLLKEHYDERYPVFHPKTGELYFASDRTGIFNIYSVDLEHPGQLKAHTNVIGGAFMPTVNARGDLVYSLYRSQGYKIYRIKRANELPLENLRYEKNYSAKIPHISADDSHFTPRKARPYSRRFGPIAFMPRLLIDYGTIKPGFYVYSSEILDKMLFFGGFDVNAQRDYDIFTIFEFRFLKPTIFLEFFYQTSMIEDQFAILGYADRVTREFRFNLMQANLGLRGKVRNWFTYSLTYTYSNYKAKSGTFSFRDPATGDLYISPAFRYTYLKGHMVDLYVKRDRIFPEVDRAINPRKGYYFSFRLAREWNQFLTDFATDRAVGAEIYKPVNFWRLSLDYEQYFPIPLTRHHSLSMRFQGGSIDRPVDDFFYFFAGGLVGLKGYPFYSIEGRHMAILSATYRFPLVRNLNWQIFSWYLDKIYLGAFYQYGNAWSEAEVNFDRFKQDVGFQVRLETFSWYMFPTRIFFEVAYPLQTQYLKEIEYPRDVRYYFGVLFDFDLRYDKKLR